LALTRLKASITCNLVIGCVFCAASGKGRVLSHAELTDLIDQLDMQPQIQELN